MVRKYKTVMCLCHDCLKESCRCHPMEYDYPLRGALPMLARILRRALESTTMGTTGPQVFFPPYNLHVRCRKFSREHAQVSDSLPPHPCEKGDPRLLLLCFWQPGGLGIPDFGNLESLDLHHAESVVEPESGVLEPLPFTALLDLLGAILTKC